MPASSPVLGYRGTGSVSRSPGSTAGIPGGYGVIISATTRPAASESAGWAPYGVDRRAHGSPAVDRRAHGSPPYGVDRRAYRSPGRTSLPFSSGDLPGVRISSSTLSRLS